MGGWVVSASWMVDLVDGYLDWRMVGGVEYKGALLYDLSVNTGGPGNKRHFLHK